LYAEKEGHAERWHAIVTVTNDTRADQPFVERRLTALQFTLSHSLTIRIL